MDIIDFAKILTATALVSTIVACATIDMHDNGLQAIATGKVVKVSNKTLVMEDKGSFLFVSLDESDKKLQDRLKKGDVITLLGKNPAKDDHTATTEIDEVVLKDGTHIPL
jgi:hypothetical protein